jgi:heat shock protein HslJ
MKQLRIMHLVALVSLLTGCAGSAGPPAVADAAAIESRNWTLVALPGADPASAAQPATLALDAAESRAAGFSGCNRYFASYELSAERLAFGPVGSTRMACSSGMELEQVFLQALPRVRAWRIDGGLLVLLDAEGRVLARLE